MWQTHIINYLQFVEVGRISTMRTWRFESLGNKFIIIVIAEALPVPGYLVQLVAWPVSWLDRFGHMNWKEDLETFTETWIEGWLGSRLQSHQHGWDDIWWHVWNFPGKKQQSSNSHLAFRSNHCPRGKLRIQIEVCLEEWQVVYTAYIYLWSAVNTKEIFKFPNIFPLDCSYLAKSVDFIPLIPLIIG